MKADFSRLRAQGEVLDEWLQQQGRVWLDSDWNEAALARRRQLEAQVADLVGVHGRPQPGTAFRLGALPSPAGRPTGDFTIGGGHGPAGHAYVDGILAANPAPSFYFSQPDYPHPPALPLPSVAVTGWQLVGDLGTARAGHAAAVLGSTPGSPGTANSVLVSGGSAGGVASAATERYDSAAATWTARAPMRVARLGHTATTLPGGKVLVTGGAGGAGLTFASAELYDPAADTWTLTGTMGSARALHTATLLPDGRVLVCGGFGQRGGSLPAPSIPTVDEALATAEIYNPATGTWTAVPNMPSARADHRAALIPASAHAGANGGKVLVTGGQHTGATIAAAELYDPAANSWASVGAMASAREAHALVVLADGRVLAAGGSATGAAGDVVLAACEVFDPGASAWLPAAPMAAARANHAGAPMAGDQALVAGGYAQGEPLRSAELYDAGDNTWRPARALNEARAAASVSVLSDGSVLLAGGTSVAGQPPAAPAAGAGGEIPTVELYHPAQTSSAFAYVEVWRRLITYLQDDQRELALGGPDTTVRARTVAQVKVLPIPAAHQPDALDCAHAAAYLPDDGAGRLSTLATSADPPTALCDLSDAGVFSGAQNLLYRVEIQDTGQMLGAPAPADLALTADVAAGATVLQVGPISADQAAALGVGRWDLLSGSGAGGRQEAVQIVRADTTGRITLGAGIRVAVSLASGDAVLTRTRNTVPLLAAAVAGATTLRVDAVRGRTLIGGSVGPLAARAWYLRSDATTEPVTITGFDATTGVVTLGEELTHAFPAGTEFVVRARFKWSSDNASYATAVTNVLSSDMVGGATTLQVSSLGRDPISRLHAGDVVELINDTMDLGRGCGLLAHIVGEPDPDTLTLTLDVADQNVQPSDVEAILADHLVLRRWDGVGFVGPDPVDLGQGVQIRFSGYDFVASTFWWFAARAATGTVEALADAPPNGIERHRMPLGLLRWSGDDETGVTLDRVTDCVPLFDPLTALQADHVDYDDSRTNLGASTVQDAIEALAPGVFPRIAAGGLSWNNDRELSLTAFNAGLTIRFTEPLNPATVTKQTFRVRVHVPDEATSLVQVLDLPGAITHQLGAAPGRGLLDGRPVIDRPGVPAPLRTGVIAATFTPSPLLDPVQVGQWLNRLRDTDPGASVRVDVVLDGDKILDYSGRRALDGTVMGRLGRDASSTFVDLRLPSGDGREGGRFESWLYVSAPAAPAQVAEIDPADGATVDAPPQAIHVMFTKDVVRTSVTTATMVVRDPTGAAVAGTIAPFPFTPSADLISGVTFTPAVPATLGTTGMYIVILRGTGASPIVDADRLPLDGQGHGGGSDFTSTFRVIAP